MLTRRRFLENIAGGAAGLGGMAIFARESAAAQNPQAPVARRQVSIAGRRVKVVDVHAHCTIPAAAGIGRAGGSGAAGSGAANGRGGRGPATAGVVGQNAGGRGGQAGGTQAGASTVLGPQRLAYMDAEGIDVQLLSINASWYALDRESAQQVCQIQNEQLAAWCAEHPTRFAAMASVALQFPDLAAQQLEDGVKKLGLRGAAIGGSVEGVELSDRRFDPFWAKAEELGVAVLMHPQTAPGTTQNTRLQGKGGLNNTIGNPLETTVFLSHLIFEGTLDRFPGLRICSAHAGGYLPSYSGRSDALCGRGGGGDCTSLKKQPSEYFKKELFVDTMIFHEEGLRHLVAEMGVGQIMYGTDYPYDWPVGVDFVLKAPFLTDAQREAILGGTASTLFRLP